MPRPALLLPSPRWPLPLALLAILGGCAECDGASVETCAVGAERSCPCPDGSDGRQLCAPGGGVWQTCWCSDGDAGAEDGGSCAAGQAPVLQIQPASHDFGQVLVGQSADQVFTLRNDGDCDLQLIALTLASGGGAGFSCVDCAGAAPRSLAPGTELVATVRFRPTQARAHVDKLLVRADDATLVGGAAQVPLSGEGLGPRLELEPAVVDFGFVGPSDPAVSRQVVVRNEGTELLRITSAYVHPAQSSSGMSVSPTLGGLDSPIELASGASQTFTVQFDPPAVAAYRAALYLMTNDLGRSCPLDPASTAGGACVELLGDSRQPPVMGVQPTSVAFGPHDLGDSDSQLVTVSNSGQSDLRVSLRMGANSSTDFDHTALSVATLLPGTSAFFTVRYRATEIGALAGQVLVDSNDPVTPRQVVALSAEGLATGGADVLKVEMSFDNGEQGFLSGDFRDVNLYLESPFGEVVDKETPAPDWSHGGNPASDFGHPTWSAAGVVEEPERITLLDTGTDAVGSFRVCVSYREDCAFVPTDLLASLLGIGASVLLDELSEGSIAPDSEEMTGYVRDNCFSHRASQARLQVFVNGQLVAAPSVSLAVTGDRACPVTLQRVRGLFCVDGAAQPGCN